MRIKAKVGPLSVSSTASVWELAEGSLSLFALLAAVAAAMIAFYASLWLVPVLGLVYLTFRVWSGLTQTPVSNKPWLLNLLIGVGWLIFLYLYRILAGAWGRWALRSMGEKCGEFGYTDRAGVPVGDQCHTTWMSILFDLMPYIALIVGVVAASAIVVMRIDKGSSYEDEIQTSTSRVRLVKILLLRYLSAYSTIALAVLFVVAAIVANKFRAMGFESKYTVMRINSEGVDELSWAWIQKRARYMRADVLKNIFGLISVVLGITSAYSIAAFRRKRLPSTATWEERVCART